VKIGPVNPEILWLQEILKMKEIDASKTYSLLGKLSGRAK